MNFERKEQRASFGGVQEVWTHRSEVLGCDMNFGIYLPRHAATGLCPVVYFLSGLTCNEQNFITKAGAQRYAAQHGLILVAPDTSPRGDEVADDEAYDLGQGAGFYLNASNSPWAKHYRMHDYVAQELPALIESHFPASDRRSICGHSMGGYGALVTAMKCPGRYASVSALAPIVAPAQVPWGQKAFSAYLGNDPVSWAEWDATALVPGLKERLPILIDQGGADEFLARELKPELLESACKAHDHPITVRVHPGYDHSYYFISSFIGEHLAHHAQALA